ncbi:transmembrane protein, putative [Bodo saltans]|uniref:Transmembrane protein, putative n=1 Tax=Bodo saltans TaxID=75058 RepID=A0A0S4IVQ2_BODSA|nr:transmembrane protein, putative [Bodo saltans]|eukprot:CUG04790.1 transmembrane protein, putative [Bodo saltans]
MSDQQQVAASPEEEKLVHPVMVRFLYGQYANLFKFALWWTSLAPLTFALFDADPTAIGVGRIVYNVALCVMSPIGGIVCERVHPRKVLLGAASVRFGIWCVLVPLTWVLFDSSWVVTSQSAIWVLFNLFLVFDGASVALSTVLDIDLCGVDIIAGRFGFEVTDHHRNQFNGRQELFFAACFVLFAPGMAFLGLAIHKGFQHLNDSVPSNALEAGTLMGIFFVTFLVATALQFYFFSSLPDDAPAPAGQEESKNNDAASQLSMGEHALNDSASGNGEAPPQEEGPPPSGWEAAKSVPADLLEALKLIWSHPPILFRLIFLGLEIAFEDAAIVVVASQMGITLPWLGDNDSVTGNVWTSVGVAAGKFGGAIASFLMIKYYVPPEEPKKFFPVFVLILLSCTVMFVFPATVDAYENGSISANSARALYLLAFFVYFFLSTLPKLGLMCLFQSMVSQVENGPRIFGFIAIVATTFDALVVMGLSVIFVKQSNIKDALWITAFVYLAHGVLELIVGPLLVLRPLQSIAQSSSPSASSEETRLTSDVGSPARKEAVEDNDALEGTGTYTQRSASVMVKPHEDHTDGAVTVGSMARSHRAAHLSISHTASVGIVTRRKQSNMEPSTDRHSTSIPVGNSPRYDREESPRGLGTSLSGGGSVVASYTRKGSRLAK